MDKEYINYLARREAILRHTEDTDIWDKLILDNSWESWIELRAKTTTSTNLKAKEFYTEHLNNIKESLRRQDKMNLEWSKLEIEYTNLYNNYSDLLKKNLELQEKLSKFEVL